MSLAALVLWLGGCTGTPITLDGGDTVATDDTVETIGGDTGGTSDTADTTDTAPETWPKACDAIYDPETLPEFHLDFPDGEWDALRNDCNNGSQAYHPVTLTLGDETVDAMVRLKGNWSWSCDKMQFVVSFDEVDPDARFHGLRKLMFDAPWYDRTLLHERVAFPIFASLGLPYSCANNAKVYVDGEYYGLYANLERIDHEYLERNFEDPGGNLYQAASELKTNEAEGDTSDLAALQAATDIDALDASIDLDEAVAEWAAEAMIPAMDNYWAGVEINYYVYDRPGDGFVWLPYDLDISFGDAAYSDGSLVWPDAVDSDPITYEHPGWKKEPLFETVLADPYWCDQFVAALERARAAYVPDDLVSEVDTWDAQIRDAMAQDPRKPFSNADHAASVASMKAFFQQRADVVDAWLAQGGHCPARW
jgi:hypothetical protein